jgi:hypothetical protein
MSNTDPTKHGCEEEFEDNQRGNQNPYIEEQITQWPKEKVQRTNNDLQNATHKTKDRVTHRVGNVS